MQVAGRKGMPQEHIISIDLSKLLVQEPGTGYNHWHVGIEPVVEVDLGDAVVYETRDAFDGQLIHGRRRSQGQIPPTSLDTHTFQYVRALLRAAWSLRRSL